MDNNDDNDCNIYNMGIENELCIVADEDSEVSLELLGGFAEILGSELVQKKVYTFPPASSVSVYTWTGCSVKLSGRVEKAEISSESMIMINVSIHACLEEMRYKAELENALGPVSLVVGPMDVGKTSFCHMLLNYAARLGRRPVFVDLDVGQNSISMPGSICILPVEKPSSVVEGFDQKALSVYPFGHKSPGHNIALYFLLIKKLGQMIKTRRKNANQNTRSSGIIIDSCGWVRGDGYSAITLAACSFEIDVLFVIEEERLYLQLKKDMPRSVQVVFVPKQYGAYERSRMLRAKNRENRIWEYFYGPRGNLIPYTIEVNFPDINIYTVKSSSNETNINAECVTADDINVVSVPFDTRLDNCILGLSFADKVDENLFVTNIIGFVCVKSVDISAQIVKLLSPQPGPLPSKIFLLGEMKLKHRDMNVQNTTVKSEN